MGILMLLFHLLKVELELFSLEDVSISSSGLAWSGGDTGQNFTLGDLLGDFIVNLSVLLSSLELALDVGGGLALPLLVLARKIDRVVLQVPVSEWSGVNLHNGVLHQSLGSSELVTSGIVDGVINSALEGSALRLPSIVSIVEFDSSVLKVATSSSDDRNLFLADLGHGWLSAHFELPLLLVDWHTATGHSLLVS